MNLVLLAGNSIHNKKWIYEVGDKLSPLFEHSYIHDYSHWESGKENIDFELEAKKLSYTISKLSNYVIFAKSVGTILSAEGIFNKYLNPSRMIFLGVPLVLVKRKSINFDAWLKDIEIPVLFMQNSEDPLGSFDALKKYITPRGNFEMIKTPGNSHNYNDLEFIKQKIADFVR